MALAEQRQEEAREDDHQYEKVSKQYLIIRW
jgi:hypothetical protein